MVRQAFYPLPDPPLRGVEIGVREFVSGNFLLAQIIFRHGQREAVVEDSYGFLYPKCFQEDCFVLLNSCVASIVNEGLTATLSSAIAVPNPPVPRPPWSLLQQILRKLVIFLPAEILEDYLSPELQEKLARDVTWTAFLAEDRSIPPEVMAKLARIPLLHRALARNTHLSAEILRTFARAKHGQSPIVHAGERVDSLFSKILPPVQQSLGENPATPPDVLVELAHSGDINVRFAVMNNPSTPKALVKELARDPDGRMRHKAKTALILSGLYS